MIAPFRSRDIYIFFSTCKIRLLGGNTIELYDSYYTWRLNDAFIPTKMGTPQEWGFCNNSIRERGGENWDYSIWLCSHTKCKGSLYLIYITISTEQDMLMKTTACSFVIFLALWLLRSKKCMILGPNYVFA